MTRILAPLSLILLGACASPEASYPAEQAEPAADRDAAVLAQLEILHAQMDQLLIQARLGPQFLPGYTIIPPLRVRPKGDQFEKEMLKQKSLLDALLAQAWEEQGENQGAKLHSAQLPTLIETDFGPGFVPASPEITLGKVVGDVITLNVSTMNPIGGPTVHHYEIKKVDGEWYGSFVGSTEYL
jgi:hypothetical protein